METSAHSSAEDAAREIARLQLAANHASNARINLLSSAKMCIFDVDADFRVLSSNMTEPILGRVERHQPITTILPETAPYFDRFRRFGEEFPKLAEAAATQPWSTVFPLPDAGGSSFADWRQSPAEAWDVATSGVRAVSRIANLDQYLTAPRELIGPAEDFRIEYTAMAPANPCDLSVVTGGRAPDSRSGVRDSRMESRGYCFAFGAFDNRVTELQRQVQKVCTTDGFLITPGQAHRCVAERIGGMVRFSVDGRLAYSVLDYLPLIGAGHGYVGLYTYAAQHAFWDLKVMVRPTCLPPETLAAVHQLRKFIVELRNAPARFVEMHYAGGRAFLVRDVTDATVRQQLLQIERHNREKLEAFLALAATAAHEMNQPLTVILCNLELIQELAPQNLPPDLRANIEDLKTSAHRMAEIVRKMSEIKQFQTTTYLGDIQMVDLDAAGKPAR